MTITQIKYFLAAIDCGSIQKAAEKNYISHQAMSKQLKALENELDMQLIDRSQRSFLSLTQEGHIFYDAWKAMIAKHEEAVSLAREFHIHQESKILVGMENLPQLVQKVLHGFDICSENHKYNFEYKLGSPDEILHRFTEHQIDIAVLLTLALDDYRKYPHMIVEQFADQPVIAMSKKNPLATKTRLTLKDLADETFIMISPSYSRVVSERQKKDLKINGIVPRRIHMIHDPKELVMNLVSNQGITLIHRMLLEGVENQVKTFPYKVAEGNENYDAIVLWHDRKHEEIAKSMFFSDTL